VLGAQSKRMQKRTKADAPPGPISGGAGSRGVESDDAVRGLGTWALVLSSVLMFLALIGATVISETAPRSCALCHVRTHVDAAHVVNSCWACHDQGTVESRVVRPARIAGMALALPGRRQQLVSPLADSACLRCHASVLTEIVTAKRIRVSHGSFAERFRCISCHGVHSPVSGRPVLDRCAECHNETGEDMACTTCHVGPIPDISTATGWLALAHRPVGTSRTECPACHVGTVPAMSSAKGSFALVHGKNSQSHGSGGTTACVLCHKGEECRACHGVQLPHGDLGAWRQTHGSDALKHRDECLRCHEAAECASCHRISMPHPKGFLARHSTEASDLGEKLCLSCHLEDDCVRCHVGHIHAHFPVLPTTGP